MLWTITQWLTSLDGISVLTLVRRKFLDTMENKLATQKL